MSAVSSRGLVLDSDVDSASRAGVVGVVGGTFAAGVVPLSCAAGISDKFLLPVEFLFILFSRSYLASLFLVPLSLAKCYI